MANAIVNGKDSEPKRERENKTHPFNVRLANDESNTHIRTHRQYVAVGLINALHTVVVGTNEH